MATFTKTAVFSGTSYFRQDEGFIYQSFAQEHGWGCFYRHVNNTGTGSERLMSLYTELEASQISISIMQASSSTAPSRWQLLYRKADGTTEVKYGPDTYAVDDAWYFIYYQWNGTHHQLYVVPLNGTIADNDGLQINSEDDCFYYSTQTKFWIGTNKNGTPALSSGNEMFDPFYIYNTLTEAEIDAIAAGDRPANVVGDKRYNITCDFPLDGAADVTEERGGLSDLVVGGAFLADGTRPFTGTNDDVYERPDSPLVVTRLSEPNTPLADSSNMGGYDSCFFIWMYDIADFDSYFDFAAGKAAGHTKFWTASKDHAAGASACYWGDCNADTSDWTFRGTIITGAAFNLWTQTETPELVVDDDLGRVNMYFHCVPDGAGDNDNQETFLLSTVGGVGTELHTATWLLQPGDVAMTPTPDGNGILDTTTPVGVTHTGYAHVIKLGANSWGMHVSNLLGGIGYNYVWRTSSDGVTWDAGTENPYYQYAELGRHFVVGGTLGRFTYEGTNYLLVAAYNSGRATAPAEIVIVEEGINPYGFGGPPSKPVLTMTAGLGESATEIRSCFCWVVGATLHIVYQSPGLSSAKLWHASATISSENDTEGDPTRGFLLWGVP